MTKHTQGPWSFYTNPVSTALEASVSTKWDKNGKSKLIARLPEMGLHYTEITANAQLIAAAPELLEALEVLLSRPNDYLLTEDRVLIENAIRKAKGDL